MPGNRRFVLGVDLDGVCADFYGGLKPVAAEWLGVFELARFRGGNGGGAS